MDRAVSIADSTDWLGTSLPLLGALDASLRCQICKDFFDTPMITSCSHTFCSLCIRRCFAVDGKCPTCRASDQESKLRHNWALQGAVDAFEAARASALELASRRETEERTDLGSKRLKRKIEDTDLEDLRESARVGVRTRASAKRDAAEADISPEVIDLNAEDISSDEPEDGLVPCPICQKRMKEAAVFSHLDKCTGENSPVPSKRAEPPRIQYSNPLMRPAPKQSVPLARIPQLNYSLLKDTALRKKLQELGIPAGGTRQNMIPRHKEWVNLWNSNCDSSKPRSKRELIHELECWERNQGSQTQATTPTVMKKDFDSQAWAKSNKNQFDELIANARARRANPTESRDESSSSGANAQGPESQYPSDSTPAEAPVVNEEEISNIREKVERLNREHHPEPQNLDMDTDIDTSLTAPDPNNRASLPEHFISSPTRKLPMFSLPEEPIMDIESGGSAVQLER